MLKNISKNLIKLKMFLSFVPAVHPLFWEKYESKHVQIFSNGEKGTYNKT
tara:strand:+ start:12502 stop:12651 length:150 start_codon:yes stop_codon:yes gene_type:complete